ncbi:GAF and ANTAR domain-containing protein [Actinocrispum sp. NPDC049592]|uniref:GAF and ANTAR domain-containing protein n=1 Tax=Actinocrispum sp. NPDC049592 TaxID=3154835 RepID=UPI0034132FB4
MQSNEDVTDLLDDVRTSMADLTAALEDDPGGPQTLTAICAEAVRVVPGADMASITSITGRTPRTEAHTDERALKVDLAQYEAGYGPCLEAARTGQTVRVSTGTAHELWPDFVEPALRHGVRSYLAAPLRVDDRLSGAINLFGFEDHGFHETDGKLLELYTTVVAFCLRTARRYRETRELAENLRAAMQSRAVIEQAKGILMAVHKITDEQAIGRLIEQSQRQNVKLREVATEFVRRMSEDEDA